MIPSAEGTSVGGKAFPSYVAFTQDGQLLVGEPARRQAVTNPNGTIKNVKRKMGTSEKVKALDKEYTPQQISAFILQKIKRDAEAYTGETIDKAVITTALVFTDSLQTEEVEKLKEILVGLPYDSNAIKLRADTENDQFIKEALVLLSDLISKDSE